jgi:hypothetical protein
VQWTRLLQAPLSRLLGWAGWAGGGLEEEVEILLHSPPPPPPFHFCPATSTFHLDSRTYTPSNTNAREKRKERHTHADRSCSSPAIECRTRDDRCGNNMCKASSSSACRYRSAVLVCIASHDPAGSAIGRVLGRSRQNRQTDVFHLCSAPVRGTSPYCSSMRE